MDHAPSRDAPRGERRPDGVVCTIMPAPHRTTPIEDALEKVGSKCVHGTFGRTVPVITHMCASVCGHTGDVGSNHYLQPKILCNAVKQSATQRARQLLGARRTRTTNRPVGQKCTICRATRRNEAARAGVAGTLHCDWLRRIRVVRQGPRASSDPHALERHISAHG